jgi:uncharacterized protein involved in outer membrane biogenesis
MTMPRPRTRRRHRVALVFALIAATLAAAVLVGRNLLEKHLREQMMPEFAQRFGRNIEIGDIDFGLGSATVSNVRVHGSMDKPGVPLAYVKSVQVELDLRSLLSGDLVVDRIALSGVEAQIFRGHEGSDNVSDLLPLLSGGGGGAKHAGPSASGRLNLSRAKLSASDVSLRVNDEVTDAWIQLRSASASLDSDRKIELSGVDLSSQLPVQNAEASLTLESAHLRVSPEGQLQLSADQVLAASTDPRGRLGAEPDGGTGCQRATRRAHRELPAQRHSP